MKGGEPAERGEDWALELVWRDIRRPSSALSPPQNGHHGEETGDRGLLEMGELPWPSEPIGSR